MSDTKSKFDSAANFIKGFNPSKPIPDNEKLVTYSLFKQSTVGNVNIERPGVLNLEGKAKWDAWNDRKGMSTEEAMNKYVEHVERLKSTYV